MLIVDHVLGIVMDKSSLLGGHRIRLERHEVASLLPTTPYGTPSKTSTAPQGISPLGTKDLRNLIPARQA